MEQGGGDMRHHWRVLVNPAAGRRGVDLPRLASALADAGVENEIEVVEGAAAMRRRAVELAGQPLALAGGDGTVSLVVDALLGAGVEQPPLIGVIPTGTGCDLLRTFGVKPTIEAAVERLAGAGEQLIDAGRLEGAFGVRHFINVAQTGAGAAAAETAPGLPRSWGRIRYPLAFLVRLPGFPRVGVHVSTGRPVAADALGVIFANAQFFAGGWNVAPKALLVDGELDVQVITAFKRQAFSLVPKIIKGVHLSDPSVIRRSAAAFEVVTDQPWPVEADGDLVGFTPIRVSTIRGAIRLKI
jgi:diacylglycerol kinase family enzyme